MWQEEVRITVNAKDSKGSTPLHILISHYNLKSAEKGEILRLLVQSGADVHAKDTLGDTPVHIASNIVFSNVVITLLVATISGVIDVNR